MNNIKVDTTLSGDLTIDKAGASLIVDSDTGTNAHLILKSNGTPAAYLYADYANTMLRLQKRTGATVENEIQIRNGATLFTQPAYVGTTGGSDKVATIADVNNKLALAGGVLTGDLTIQKTSPWLKLRNSGTGNNHIEYQDDADKRVAIMYWDTANRKLILNSYLADGTSVGAQIQIQQAAITMSKSLEVVGTVSGTVSPTLDDHLTRKAYVDGNFVGKDTNAEGTVLFQPSVNNDWRFYSTTTATNILRFHNHNGTSNILESWINAGKDSITIRKFDAVEGNNDFSIRGDYTSTNKVMRAATPVGTTDLTTKAYVDDNFVSLTNSEDIGGNKTFTNLVTFTSNTVDIVSEATNFGSSPYIDFIATNAADERRRVGILYCNNANNVMELRKYNRTDGSTVTNNLKIGDTSASFETPLYVGAPTTGGHAVTLTYAQDNLVRQPTAYSMIMPTAAPTVGQILAVASISGTVMTMQWITPA